MECPVQQDQLEWQEETVEQYQHQVLPPCEKTPPHTEPENPQQVHNEEPYPVQVSMVHPQEEEVEWE